MTKKEKYHPQTGAMLLTIGLKYILLALVLIGGSIFIREYLIAIILTLIIAIAFARNRILYLGENIKTITLTGIKTFEYSKVSKIYFYGSNTDVGSYLLKFQIEKREFNFEFDSKEYVVKVLNFLVQNNVLDKIQLTSLEEKGITFDNHIFRIN